MLGKVTVRPLHSVQCACYEESVQRAKQCWKHVEDFLTAKAAGDIETALKARLAIGRAVPPGIYRGCDPASPAFVVIGVSYRATVRDPESAFVVTVLRICSDNRIEQVRLLGSDGFLTPVKRDGPQSGSRYAQIGEVRDLGKCAA